MMTPESATPELSVVIATRNRPEPLRRLLRSLDQEFDSASFFEIVIVDDGSDPPLEASHFPGARLIRTPGVERSRARNQGAEAALGRLLLFLDDDLEVEDACLSAHILVHTSWPTALVVGNVGLPDYLTKTPFGNYRGDVDWQAFPLVPGPAKTANFCTAQNMSVDRKMFLADGGFDPGLVVSEDQDLGRRWLAAGREVVYGWDARVVHHDATDTLAKYLRRMEFGYFHMVAFARKYPDDPDSIRRAKVNGPIRLGREPLARSGVKLLKSILGWPPLLALVVGLIKLRERKTRRRGDLARWYRFAVGIAIQRGWRAGLVAASRK